MSHINTGNISYRKRLFSEASTPDRNIFTFEHITFDIMEVSMMWKSAQTITLRFKNKDTVDIWANSVEDGEAIWKDLNLAKRGVASPMESAIKLARNNPILLIMKLLLPGVKK